MNTSPRRAGRRFFGVAAAALLATLVTGCGGGGSSADPVVPPPAASTYKVGGALIGLAPGAQVVLSNGAAQVTVAAAGNFEFATPVADGTAYAVAVATQPAGQFCNVAQAAGTVNAAPVTSISVACAVVLAGGSGDLAAAGGTFTSAAVDVTAPSAASLAAQTVTVATMAPPSGLPSTLTAVGAALNVSISKPEALNAPLILNIRYDANAVANEDNLAVVHYNTATSRYEPVTVLEQDKATHSFRIEARSFSPFLVVSFLSSVVPTSYTVPNFTPAANGWNIGNNAATYHTAGGNCLGMSGYANWFFSNRTEMLSTKYSAAGVSPTSIAELVATRAHLAQSQYWAQKSNTYLNRLGNAATARLMRLYLALLQQPVILLMGVDGSPRHASVLYGYDSTGFRFYDVNVPGAAQTVTFDGSNWGTYSGYNSFSFVGLPSLGRTEDFAQLTTEAEGGFTSSSLITLTSPTPDQAITARQVTLTGSLSGTLNSNASLVAYVKGVEQVVSAGTGSFSATLPISAGSNTIVLFAGVNLQQQSNWYRNAATRILNVSSTLPLTSLLTTLTWDQNNSDVDLYVTEPAPSNQTAWYSNQTTSNRLALDFDNTSGFGPEHTTVSTLGSTPGTVLPGLYTIRVHYFGETGAGQTVSGTVSVLVNEGLANQKLLTKRFTLTGPNSSNDGPGGTGGNWADIATVDLVNGVINLSP